MLQCVLAPAHIQCVAVRQEGTSSQLFHHVRDRLRIVWTEKRKIPRLSEVNFNRCHFLLKINVPYPGLSDQFLQLFRKIRARKRTHVCKINF